MIQLDGGGLKIIGIHLVTTVITIEINGETTSALQFERSPTAMI
jgi:hypothetical protein